MTKTNRDRRGHERFDVVGALWGQLVVEEEVHVRNVSTTGALVDSPLPAALNAEQTIGLVVDGQSVSVNSRVRHVRDARTGGEGRRYLIGLEFISPPIPILQSVEQLGSGARDSQFD